MDWDTCAYGLRFYVVCPRTHRKIYIRGVPSNPFEARIKRQNTFSIKCRHCGEKHEYTVGDVHAERRHRNSLRGIIVGVIMVFFITILLVLPCYTWMGYCNFNFVLSICLVLFF